MSTEADVVNLLLELQLLSTEDAVCRELLVQDFSRRNHNFAVQTDDGCGYLVKVGDLRQSSPTLRREADIYRFLWAHETDFARNHVPALRHRDENGTVLIVDYLRNTESLVDTRLVAGARATACAIALGQALGRLHKSPHIDHCDHAAPTPWVLSVCAPALGMLADFSSGSLSAIRIVQESSVIQRCLADLSPLGGQALIHGDARLDNCLVRLRPGTEPGAFYLIDWELAGVGDPAWDVGTVFCEYLGVWVRSLPVAPVLSIKDSLDLAAHPLQAVRPNLLAFWRAYCQESDARDDEPDLLLRSVQSAGVRLIQAAIESAQSSNGLTGTVVCIVQLAENILADPSRAGRCLMGLPTT